MSIEISDLVRANEGNVESCKNKICQENDISHFFRIEPDGAFLFNIDSIDITIQTFFFASHLRTA